MKHEHQKAAPPDRRNAADGQEGCASPIPTTHPSDQQAEQTQPAAFWRKVTPNQCADCGKLLGDDWTGYDNDSTSNRGRLWCDPCTMRRDATR